MEFRFKKNEIDILEIFYLSMAKLTLKGIEIKEDLNYKAGEYVLKIQCNPMAAFIFGQIISKELNFYHGSNRKTAVN